ncbi:MAG TPA: hypothetical protein VFH68_13095 [Polyangia bacterium]|nr:hypothetical protein [Polyangia bacterium]
MVAVVAGAALAADRPKAAPDDPDAAGGEVLAHAPVPSTAAITTASSPW